MAVNEVVTKIQEQGNGTKDTFDFPFAIYEATDLVVYLVDRATDALIGPLAINSDYTVEFDIGDENTGSVTYAHASIPTTAQDSLIVSAIPETQTISLPLNGKFREDQIEVMGDRCVRLIQQLDEALGRCIKVGININIDGDLPNPESGRVLGWNSTGDAIINYDLGPSGATGPTGAPGLDGATGPTGPTGATGAFATSGTFDNSDLTTGVFTITHNLALSAPYALLISIFDNNNKQILPDEVTGAMNTTAIDLASYGTISGTWGYRYI